MIYKYEILNPKRDKTKPYINKHEVLVIPNLKEKYRYYIEAISTNPNNLTKNYVLLLSTDKFDEQCKTCRIDDFGRLKVNIKGEFKNYIINELKSRPNINIEYLESEDNYDVYLVE